MSRYWTCALLIALALGGCDSSDDATDVADSTRSDSVDAAEVAGGLPSGLAFVAQGALHIDVTEEEWRRMQKYALPSDGVPRSNPTNVVAGDDAAASLGQALFFDARLSGTGEYACASCHDPEKGWSDGEATASTLGTGSRNTPTLWNVGAQRWLFWDGRADSLWAQALGPIENPIEMGGDRLAVAHLLSDDSTLKAAYESVFGAMPDLSDPARFPDHARPVVNNASDPLHVAWAGLSAEDRDVINRIYSNAGKAIEAYERQIVSVNAPFDQFLEGLLEDDMEKVGRLSEEAQRGLKIFMGSGSCHLCHTGPWFTNLEFHNIGLESPPGPLPDIGRTQGVEGVLQDTFNGLGAYSDAPEASVNDKLRFLKRNASLTDGAFKTPTLRNIAQTGPYMHDGRFEQLDDVLSFYNELPGTASVGHREESLQPLELSDDDRRALRSFLESLTGEPLAEHLTTAP